MPAHPDTARARRLLDAPMVKWSRIAARLAQAGHALQVRANLDAHTVRAARAAAYLDAIANGYSPADACKAQNTAARKVRKALGYAYPNQPISF